MRMLAATMAAMTVLTTVLFMDIVGSTQRASELGDRAWRTLLERHDELLRREIHRLGGRGDNNR